MSSKKFIMTSKTCQNAKKFIITSKTHHDVKKFVKTSKSSSWRQNTPWRQIMVTASKIHETYVMTSKTWSWRQQVCCDIKGKLWRQNLRHDVKNFQSYLKCKIRFLFAFVLRICWPPPIWHLYNVSFPSYQRLCAFHNFGDLDLWQLIKRHPVSILFIWPHVSSLSPSKCLPYF